MSRPGAIILVVLAISAIAVPSGSIADSEDPTIERVEPNPVSDGNLGEFIVLSVPSPQNVSGWTLTDGTSTADLPNRTIDGEVALTQHPRMTVLKTDLPVLGWDGHLALAADGDEIRLESSSGRVVDTFVYGSTRSGLGWSRGDESATSTTDHLGGFDARSVDHGTAFVLPDDPDLVLDTFESAEERIWVAGYELTDPYVVDILLERYAAGVDVRVLIDGNPVGGQAETEEHALDRLTTARIPVDVITGDRRRFRYHHPKYAIVDETSIVMSENWKPAGVGGTSSRGWGVAIDDPELVEDLGVVFTTDAKARDRVPWIPTTKVDLSSSPNVSEPLGVDHHPAERVHIESAELIVAPGDAHDRVREAIDDAAHQIDIQQVRIADVDFPLLRAVIEKAREGVAVRIHLDSTWYVAKENAVIVEHLERLASHDDLDLRVTKAEPADRYEKVHNKGVIIDEETVILGSMNWNNVSMLENREVMVILEGEEVAAYYTEVFEGDWDPPGDGTPIGFIAFVVSLWIGAVVIAYRRVSFDPD